MMSGKGGQCSTPRALVAADCSPAEEEVRWHTLQAGLCR